MIPKLSLAPPCRLAWVLLPVIVLTACASTHDLKTGPGLLGGGVSHDEVKPGLFRVHSQTNWAPWPNPGSARSAWADEAGKACKGKAWREIDSKEVTRDTGKQRFGELKYLVSEKLGYALCDGALTNVEEAMKWRKIEDEAMKQAY